MRVLLIDDDEKLAEMLTEYLCGWSITLDAAFDAATGMAAIKKGGYDALILDVMLPDGNGFDICQSIRAFSDIPIVMLTARGEDTDRIVGLELGADDYLPKPFNPRELVARVKSILRRTSPPKNERLIKLGRLVLDLQGKTATRNGLRCDLTVHQFEILALLGTHAGRVLSREYLMDHLKGETFESFDRSIDVHVSRIRAAIETDPKKPEYIITVRGAGYMFVLPATAEDEG